jgi:hypothetical protein
MKRTSAGGRHGKNRGDAPLSSRKRWRVVEIIAKATLVAPVPEVQV